MHLKEIGWQSETSEVGHISGIIDHNNETWRPIDAVTWINFQEEIEAVRIKKLWQQASEHRGGANLAQGVDLSVAQRHYKGLVNAGKHREAGALMTICTGACWSPARLLEEGIISQEEATCPLCGQVEADDGHVYWECPKGNGVASPIDTKIKPILC